MPAEISIAKRRGKAKVKVSTKRAMSDAVLEEVKSQGFDMDVAMIQGLIPLGLKAVEDRLQREVALLAGKRQAHGKENVRWGKQAGSVYLREQKVPIMHPRVRNKVTDTEVSISAYEQMQEPYRGDRQTMLRLLQGISTHKYSESMEGIGAGGIWDQRLEFVEAVQEEYPRPTAGAEEPLVEGIRFRLRAR